MESSAVNEWGEWDHEVYASLHRRISPYPSPSSNSQPSTWRLRQAGALLDHEEQHTVSYSAGGAAGGGVERIGEIGAGIMLWVIRRWFTQHFSPKRKAAK
jgi:hypothetical protein